MVVMKLVTKLERVQKNFRLKAQIALVIDIVLKLVILMMFIGEALGLRRDP